jgi:hypothetical protein
MNDPIVDRINFYAILKLLAEKTHLITDADCAYLVGENPSKSLQCFLSRTFDINCLLVTYVERFYYQSIVIRFNVWGKFTQDESLFIMGVAPLYVKTFCEEILPTLKTNCSTVGLAVYSQLRDKPYELYCNLR